MKIRKFKRKSAGAINYRVNLLSKFMFDKFIGPRKVFHFFETNKYLQFRLALRMKCRRKALNVPR